MDSGFKKRFMELWARYFPTAELPIGFYYSDEKGECELAKPPRGHRCVICDLAKVRKGKPLAFDESAVTCGGGQRFLGFAREKIPGLEYFLSYGIEGKMEGERYKKSPELVREMMGDETQFQAPAKYILFKRWDSMDESDEPAVVIFFAPPDVLSGLFTLANFDEPDLNGVIAPFGAGCSTIVDRPSRELGSPRPRAVLGMFDVSARPCVRPDILTLSAPWPKFVRMVENIEESFLITGSWNRVRDRIRNSA